MIHLIEDYSPHKRPACRTNFNENDIETIYILTLQDKQKEDVSYLTFCLGHRFDIWMPFIFKWNIKSWQLQLYPGGSNVSEKVFDVKDM